MPSRTPTTRYLLAIVIALLVCACAATAAGATTFGGLGQVGSGLITAGTEGKHGQVAPHTQHEFAVDPKTGNLFVVDEIAEEKHNHGRIQEFGPKGEFLAENRFPLIVKTAAELGGIAVDSVNGRVYVLVNEARAEEEETPVFDPGLKAAGAIWSFSTEVKLEKLQGQKQLIGTELHALSEEPKAALLAPAGIAVDPKSGDVVILAQQDESTTKGAGEEQLRSALQRVHANGKPGPRYVDQGNCLDGAEPSPEEKTSKERPCEERPAEATRSPIVTSQGDVYVENENEIWEIPSPTAGEEEFKDVVVHPKRVFTLGALQSLITTGGREEQAGTMSFRALEGGAGRIYITSNIGAEAGVSSESGVVVLNWAEKTSETAEVSELGWTGGESPVSPKHPNCAIPIASVSPLVSAGKGEESLVFDATSALEGSHVQIFAFGPGASAQPCGHPEVSPPVVEVGEETDASKVETGKATTLSAKVTGANAKSTKWKLVLTPKGGGEKVTEEFTTGYQFERPSFPHEFTRVGEYEVTATVETDNLGTPVVVREAAHKVTTTASRPKVKLIAPKAPAAGERVAFEATVTDDNAAAPHLKYTWNFGDGSPAVVEEEAATKQTVTRRVEHAFASRCGGICTVVVEVEDQAEKTVGREKAEVPVGEGAAEREARERAEQAHQREVQEAAENAQRAQAAAEASRRAAAAQQQLEREAHEKAEREHQEVLAFQSKHNPEATVVGAALSVKKSGLLAVKLSCPSTEASACVGTLTLRTLTAIKVGRKKAVVTLATVPFSIPGGQAKTLSVHLSASARSLLLRLHSLRARATVVAHDAANASRTTASTLTLRLVKH